LPTPALGWSTLFHLERALLLLALLGGALLVMWRATAGDLPRRLGHIEYDAAAVDVEAAQIVLGLEERIRYVEGSLGIPREEAAR
jgi:hypothetical protein